MFEEKGDKIFSPIWYSSFNCPDKCIMELKHAKDEPMCSTRGSLTLSSQLKDSPAISSPYLLPYNLCITVTIQRTKEPIPLNKLNCRSETNPILIKYLVIVGLC